MTMKSSKEGSFPVQICAWLLHGSMLRRLHKTHHLEDLNPLGIVFFNSLSH
jgi:hypothetical protein